MKFQIDLATGSAPLTFEHGESIEIPISWKNADGTTRSMTGATVTVKVFDSRDVEQVAAATLMNSNTLISVAAATTAGWRGRYRFRLEEDRSTDSPPSVGMGEFSLLVV